MKKFLFLILCFFASVQIVNASSIDSIDMDRLEDDHGYMNQHHYKWVDIKDLDNIKMVPIEIKNAIMTDIFSFHYVMRDV